jgi:hypothetical protein
MLDGKWQYHGLLQLLMFKTARSCHLERSWNNRSTVQNNSNFKFSCSTPRLALSETCLALSSVAWTMFIICRVWVHTLSISEREREIYMQILQSNAACFDIKLVATFFLRRKRGGRTLLVPLRLKEKKQPPAFHERQFSKMKTSSCSFFATMTAM